MSSFEIQWFQPGTGLTYVSIASYGITFNKAAADELGNPVRVQIGVDAGKQVLLVKPILEVDATLEKQSFPFAERERNGQVRVSSREFIHYLGLKIPGLDLDRSTRFVGEWDATEGLLIVDLQKPVNHSIDEESDVAEEEANKIATA